jgi:hypothetical protein
MASLTGHVSHYTEEVAAERAARRVKGVHAIAEEIEVRCLGETSDEEIARRASTFSTTRLDLCRRERTELSAWGGNLTGGLFFQFPTFICP